MKIQPLHLSCLLLVHLQPQSSLQIEKECYVITFTAVFSHNFHLIYFILFILLLLLYYLFLLIQLFFFYLQLRNVNLSCVRTCMVVAEERPRIALTQSFSKIFKDLGLSSRAVSTTFGCRVNVAICLQVSRRRVGEGQISWWSMF